MSYSDDVLEQIDTKLDELEVLIRSLPLNPAVKDKLADKVYEMWTDIEDCMDLSPTDWK